MDLRSPEISSSSKQSSSDFIVSAATRTYILYSETTQSNLAQKLGFSEYSYFFVRELFRRMLLKRYRVIVVNDPEREVDAIYNECLSAGEACVFLSFAPPHRSFLHVRCPTIPIFAWEFDTIPTEQWDEDPRSDWRFVLARFGQAITHSQYSANAIKSAMGPDFPVLSIPAPQWDLCRHALAQDAANVRCDIHLYIGNLIDSHGTVELAQQLNKNLEAPPASFKRLFHRLARAIRRRIRRITPHRLAVRTVLKIGGGGVVFTSVFNPYDGRKNWPDMLTAFCSACASYPDATLILKLVCSDSSFAIAEIESWLIRLPPHDCRVVVIGDFLGDDDYRMLMRGTTFVVNASLCEGQCLPLMEFMSCGKPAIAPKHSGMAEFLSEDVSIIIETSVELGSWPHDPRAALRAHRYRINWDSTRQAFLRSYKLAKEQPQRYDEMSANAVSRLRDFCSEEVVDRRLQQFVDQTLLQRIHTTDCQRSTLTTVGRDFGTSRDPGDSQ